MSDAQVCGVKVDHPEFGSIACELEPHDADTPHKWRIPETEEAIEWGDVDESPTAGAVFDLEAFVKALPDGVVLCPMCLGSGGVVDDPPFDPHTYRCPSCNGHGQVRTGSRQSGDNAQTNCRDCNGTGYRQRGDAPPATPARAADFSGDVPPVDAEGRTPDHPDFDWSRVTRDIEPIPEPAPA